MGRREGVLDWRGLRSRDVPWLLLRSLLVAPVLFLLACQPEPRPTPDAGAAATTTPVPLPEPWPKPAFTLLDTSGRPYEFRKETDGRLTLLFFGYTSCPDVCPIHMAGIAGALKQLPFEVTNQVKVVFVTTDPERDTPEAIRAWLDHFDGAFVGLTGPADSLAAIQQRARLGAATKLPFPKGGPGAYLVGHASWVIAYTKDNQGRYLFPGSTRQREWVEGIRRLVTEG